MKFPSGGDRFGVSSVLTYFCLLPQRTLVGLVRDLRGIAFAFNAKTSFMMLFEWMYPNSKLGVHLHKLYLEGEWVMESLEKVGGMNCEAEKVESYPEGSHIFRVLIPQ